MIDLFIVIIVIAIIYVIIDVANSSSKIKEVSKLLKRIPDFNPTEELMGSDLLTGIALDENRNKICLIKKIKKKYEFQVFEYRELLSSELLEDGSSISKTSRGSQIGGALIGGLVLGPVGLLLGGLTGKKETIDKITRIDLAIVVNDSSDPRHIINLLNIETKKDNYMYQSTINKARLWQSKIEVLIKQADIDDSKNKIISNSNNSIADELKKLSELKISGVLSELEYQQQKRKLLNG